MRRQADPAVVPENFKDIAPLEVLDNLSIDANAPNYVVKVLKQNSNLIEAQVLAGNVAPAARHSPWRLATRRPLPLVTQLSFQINLDGDGFQEVTLPAAEVSAQTPRRT